MGRHLKDYILTEEWVDLTTLDDYNSIAGVEITVQAKFVRHAFVFLGGTTAPEDLDPDLANATNQQGSLLQTGVALTQTSDHWWVRGHGRLSILIEQ